MTHSLTILWPDTADPEIDEIRFSFDFCRKISRKFCEMAYPDILWFDYTDLKNMETALSRAEGRILILVREPEVVISPQAIGRFLSLARNGHDVCGPVFNQTACSTQTASLPAPYVDMDSFLEIAGIMAHTQQGNLLQTQTLETACISYRLGFLKNPGIKDNPLAVLKDPGSHPFPLTVACDALVHLGFTNAFTSARDDLVRLVPEEGVNRILDVGCAKGGYGKTLKRLRPDVSLTGVELNPLMAKAAGHIYDEVINVPMEEARFSAKFDLINCGDILEHLADPWAMLKRFHGLLGNKGSLVLSIPNVGHWSVARALLKGTFQYIPLGILCIGHLRWFTESSIRGSLRSAGFSVEILEREQIPPTPDGEKFIFEMCCSGHADEQSLRTNEFIIRAVKR